MAHDTASSRDNLQSDHNMVDDNPEAIVDIRAAMVFRAARTALGWSQEDAAHHSGLAKTTIARIETISSQNSLNNVFSLISTYQAFGIEISNLMHDDVTIKINKQAMQEAAQNIKNPERKRSDTGQKRSPK